MNRSNKTRNSMKTVRKRKQHVQGPCWIVSEDTPFSRPWGYSDKRDHLGWGVAFIRERARKKMNLNPWAQGMAPRQSSVCWKWWLRSLQQWQQLQKSQYMSSGKSQLCPFEAKHQNHLESLLRRRRKKIPWLSDLDKEHVWDSYWSLKNLAAIQSSLRCDHLAQEGFGIRSVKRQSWSLFPSPDGTVAEGPTSKRSWASHLQEGRYNNHLAGLQWKSVQSSIWQQLTWSLRVPENQWFWVLGPVVGRTQIKPRNKQRTALSQRCGWQVEKSSLAKSTFPTDAQNATTDDLFFGSRRAVL